jgi:hypothetical protein
VTRRRRIPGIVAALSLAAGGALFGIPEAAFAQFQTLIIGINGENPEPVRPTAPVNNLQDLMRAFRGCWSPPPVDSSRQPVDLIFRVSFKRSGELLGKPPFIEFVREVTPEQRALYYTAVAEAIDRCSKMPFTESMGGASAGRVFRINFVDGRNRKQAEVSWLTTKTS